MGKQIGAVLFLGKAGDRRTEKAAEFCRNAFPNVSVCLGEWDDPRPAAVDESVWGCIISYLSRWIVPEQLLKQARLAINFHPGPPEYPGYGCNNFAIYEGAKSYGVTCHRMAPKVDTGAILAVKRFPVLPADNAATLLERAYDYQLVLFYEIMARVLNDSAFVAVQEQWSRKPFTRKEYARLTRIAPDMSKDEVERRIRATNMGAWKPTVDVQGYVFELKTD